MIRRTIALGLLLALGALAAVALTGCGGQESTSTTTEATTQETTTQTTGGALTLPSARRTFAAIASVPLRPGVTSYGGPPSPGSLEGVKMVASVRKALGKPGVSEALVEHGFAVVPSDLRLFHFAYDGAPYEGWPVFVTTDVAYHQWHLIFDKLLRTLEQKVLLPKLVRLVSGLLDAAHTQALALAGTTLEEDASRVEQLYQVTAAELALDVPLGPLARQEKALVDAHGTKAASPLLGLKIDYSLFAPRGHYTRNADLRRYFTAMSVLGQSEFCLPKTVDCPGIEPSRLAILASRVLAGSPELVALWRQIYEPTAFLVGTADDYTPLEVAAATASATPAGLNDAGVFVDDVVVEDVIAALTSARPVLISPDRAAIRIMGTRFVVDSFVLDQLLYPYVGTRDNQRLMPSALDLAAAFGSEFAYGVQQDAGETGYANYDAQLAALRKAIAARPEEDWGSTVYDAWLWALEPSFADRGEEFPGFMRSQEWTAKAHQSGFGSYAELKHDTILYTKQAVAEGGENPAIPARRNWVEPEPVVFGRLAATADLMRRGLAARSLLTPEARRLLLTGVGLFRFFERIAADELAGKPISARDNERLTYIGGAFEALFMRTGDFSPAGALAADRDGALVADIASSAKGVLEVATGRVDRIYVLVPDDSGAFQVAVGGVYSYYEFASPPGERLTDEAWRAKLDAGEAPARPAWEEAFLVR